MTSPLPPIACTLTDDDAANQALEWVDLQRHALGVIAVPGGARMSFPTSLDRQLADLTTRESACCAFLDIVTTRDDDEIVIDITSANPDALPVILRLSGIESGD